MTTGVYQRSYQSPEIPNKGKYSLMSWRRQTSDKNGELLVTVEGLRRCLGCSVCLYLFMIRNRSKVVPLVFEFNLLILKYIEYFVQNILGMEEILSVC